MHNVCIVFNLINMFFDNSSSLNIIEVIYTFRVKPTLWIGRDLCTASIDKTKKNVNNCNLSIVTVENLPS